MCWLLKRIFFLFSTCLLLKSGNQQRREGKSFSVERMFGGKKVLSFRFDFRDFALTSDTQALRGKSETFAIEQDRNFFFLLKISIKQSKFEEKTNYKSVIEVKRSGRLVCVSEF